MTMRTGSLLICLAAFAAVSTQCMAADDKKKDEKVIGSDKKTGGEAAGDREKMNNIQEGAKRLKEKSEKEREERKANKDKKTSSISHNVQLADAQAPGRPVTPEEGKKQAPDKPVKDKVAPNEPPRPGVPNFPKRPPNDKPLVNPLDKEKK